ncbi:hypothetical protein BOTBODRAFT_221527 [Botryobasidium botryosum FD-172 SS1]|uniref:Uncharacterized protein n=1 Tax=Botryobasidium botryosum (strain FD-172 SS1) TaxID=930990 RepID=A0A067MQI1_BOTB1|nr:hypothetical protein BOTBODRAFT_221527 [Botryobasidium botryosum FD-172 SS1]
MCSCGVPWSPLVVHGWEKELRRFPLVNAPLRFNFYMSGMYLVGLKFVNLSWTRRVAGLRTCSTLSSTQRHRICSSEPQLGGTRRDNPRIRYCRKAGE